MAAGRATVICIGIASRATGMAPVVTSSASIMSVSTELSGAALVNTLIVGA